MRSSANGQRLEASSGSWTVTTVTPVACEFALCQSRVAQPLWCDPTRFETVPNGDGISSALIRAPSDCGKGTVSVTPGNSGSHRGLGGEMVMHARAPDADLGRKVAKAEAPVSGVADMGLGQVHQSFGGLT